MQNGLNRLICVVLLVLIGASSLPPGARADEEPTAMGGGAVTWLAAGALALNAGAAIANGAALAAGKPDRGHGMFGIVLGGASVAASAATLAFSGDDSHPETFSLVLAGCGLASLVTGYLNVRAAGRGADARPPRTQGEGAHGARLVLAPAGGQLGLALAVRVEF